MRKATLPRLLALVLLALASGAAAHMRAQEVKPGPARYFVAMNGNDAWSGTLPAPNREKTDGPLASLERARDVIRKLKAAGAKDTSPTGGVVVFVRGGVYSLSRTFKLGIEDSGTPASPVIYCAFGNEEPVLTGGRRLTGFTPYKGDIFKVDVSVPGSQNVDFHQLFFNGKRQNLARYPNVDPDDLHGGWAYNISDGGRRTLQYSTQDARTWAHPETGEVVVFPQYNWIDNILGIASIDRKERIITLAADASYNIIPGDRYFVRNLFEELDSPGEWYFDRKTQTLYFWPPSDLKSGVVYIPVLENLLEISSAANVTFRGFTIEYGEGTAIVVRDSTNCLIAGNIIRNVGAYATNANSAVAIDGGSNNGVVGNNIYEIGSNAITLSGGDRKTLTAAHNYADNNYIHHTGVFYKQGVGIDISGVGNRASHNLIHDCPRFGIIFDGNDQIIEYNHIRHVSLETSDTGAIYCGGRDWVTPRGSVIRYNFLHDILGYGRKDGRWVSPYYAWGIYLDDNSSGVDVTGNIVARAIRGPIHLHNARDNVIDNNVFIDGALQQVELNGWPKDSVPFITHLPTMTKGYEEYARLPVWRKYRNLQGISPKDAVPMANNKLLRNIIYYREPSAKLYSYHDLPYKSFESDYNLVYHFGLPLLLSDLTNNANSVERRWEDWQKMGFDQHSLAADPLFVDAQNADYRLRPDSPAFKLGFKPIPVEKIGPYKDPLRATWPIVEAVGAREAARQQNR